MSVILYSNNHSVFSLHYHLIMVVRYRKKVIDDGISNELRSIFERIGESYHIEIEEWNHDTDHIHVLFRAHPRTELTKFINAYKSASSRLIKKDHPELKRSLWKEMFWTRSFCLLTTGGASIDVIRRYIETQGERMDRHDHAGDHA